MVTCPKVFPLTPMVFKTFHLERNVFDRRELYTHLPAVYLGDSPGSNCTHDNYINLNSFCCLLQTTMLIFWILFLSPKGSS